jgi:hypothetical protein
VGFRVGGAAGVGAAGGSGLAGGADWGGGRKERIREVGSKSAMLRVRWKKVIDDANFLH